jgi:hypothetical protein
VCLQSFWEEILSSKTYVGALTAIDVSVDLFNAGGIQSLVDKGNKEN